MEVSSTGWEILPDEVLNARKNNSLVIFTGAGVSKPQPSNLPLFGELVQLLVDGTQYASVVKLPFDRFLGNVEENGAINIRQRVAEILGDPQSQPNELHKNIPKIFTSPDQIRIVTTNFDRHFTQTVQALSPTESEIFYAPALPLGNDFAGLIYVHGSIDKDLHHLVLTDRDFGRAYLTEGWARRFLVSLFNEYTVLFIGYRHEDLDLIYLARALYPGSGKQRYALTHEEDQSRWNTLGIQPIKYERAEDDDQHTNLTRLISSWATSYAMSPTSRERSIQALVASPPGSDINAENRLLKDFHDRDTVRYFVRHAKFPEWLEWAEERDLLNPLFQDQNENEEIVRWLANWIADNYVLDHHDKVLAIIAKSPAPFKPFVWEVIAHSIAYSTVKPRSEILSKWVFTILGYCPNIYEMEMLFHFAYNYKYPELGESGFAIFDHFTRPRLIIKENIFSGMAEFGSKDAIMYEVDTPCAPDILKHFWETYFKPHLDETAYILEPIVESHLRLSYLTMKGIRKASEQFDIRSHFRDTIEFAKDKIYLSGIDVLVDAARDILEWCITNNSIRAEFIINSWYNSNVPLLKRIAVHGIAKR